MIIFEIAPPIQSVNLHKSDHKILMFSTISRDRSPFVSGIVYHICPRKPRAEQHLESANDCENIAAPWPTKIKNLTYL